MQTVKPTVQQPSPQKEQKKYPWEKPVRKGTRADEVLSGHCIRSSIDSCYHACKLVKDAAVLRNLKNLDDDRRAYQLLHSAHVCAWKAYTSAMAALRFSAHDSLRLLCMLHIRYFDEWISFSLYKAVLRAAVRLGEPKMKDEVFRLDPHPIIDLNPLISAATQIKAIAKEKLAETNALALEKIMANMRLQHKQNKVQPAALPAAIPTPPPAPAPVMAATPKKSGKSKRLHRSKDLPCTVEASDANTGDKDFMSRIDESMIRHYRSPPLDLLCEVTQLSSFTPAPGTSTFSPAGFYQFGDTTLAVLAAEATPMLQALCDVPTVPNFPVYVPAKRHPFMERISFGRRTERLKKNPKSRGEASNKLRSQQPLKNTSADYRTMARQKIIKDLQRRSANFTRDIRHKGVLRTAKLSSLVYTVNGLLHIEMSSRTPVKRKKFKLRYNLRFHVLPFIREFMEAVPPVTKTSYCWKVHDLYTHPNRLSCTDPGPSLSSVPDNWIFNLPSSRKHNNKKMALSTRLHEEVKGYNSNFRKINRLFRTRPWRNYFRKQTCPYTVAPRRMAGDKFRYTFRDILEMFTREYQVKLARARNADEYEQMLIELSTNIVLQPNEHRFPSTNNRRRYTKRLMKQAITKMFRHDQWAQWLLGTLRTDCQDAAALIQVDPEEKKKRRRPVFCCCCCRYRDLMTKMVEEGTLLCTKL